ncbi:hypothetical protein D3C78_1213880 [compost metagenome]
MWQNGFNIGATNGHFAGFQHFTLGIAGGGGLPQLHDRLVTFVGIEQVLGKLGGLTEAQRQHATGQRVETAGVTGLLGIEQPADLLQRSVGGKPQRLVEQDDATDVTTNTLDLGHRLLLGVRGIGGLVLTVFGNSTLDQRRQVGTTRHALVVVEMQLRHTAQFHFLAQLHAQEACGGIEHFKALLDVFSAVLAHHGDIHLGVADIAADVDGSDGHKTHAWIFDFATNQLREFTLHLIANALGTAIFFGHFCYL